jgi:hypothetical protein
MRRSCVRRHLICSSSYHPLPDLSSSYLFINCMCLTRVYLTCTLVSVMIYFFLRWTNCNHNHALSFTASSAAPLFSTFACVTHNHYTRIVSRAIPFYQLSDSRAKLFYNLRLYLIALCLLCSRLHQSDADFRIATSTSRRRWREAP